MNEEQELDVREAAAQLAVTRLSAARPDWRVRLIRIATGNKEPILRVQFGSSLNSYVWVTTEALVRLSAHVPCQWRVEVQAALGDLHDPDRRQHRFVPLRKEEKS